MRCAGWSAPLLLEGGGDTIYVLGVISQRPYVELGEKKQRRAHQGLVQLVDGVGVSDSDTATTSGDTEDAVEAATFDAVQSALFVLADRFARRHNCSADTGLTNYQKFHRQTLPEPSGS